ncbi:MAG: Mu-like prophage major head subunit gpT family protein [Ferrovibrionaceae bacterium]
MEINRANLGKVFTGYKTIFQSAFEGAPSDWNRVAMEVPSTTGTEEYGWLGQSTRFREWLGSRVLQNLKAHGYSIRNKDFENTVTVDRNAINDDQYGVYSPLIAQLGQDAKQHPDELVFGLLKDGFTKTCYDGQYFFDTDHPVTAADGSVTSVSNTGGGSGAPWFLLDMSKVVKPIIYQKRQPYNFVSKIDPNDDNVFHNKEFVYGVDGRGNVGFGLWQIAYGSKATLNPTNYAAARAALVGMKGDNGKPLGVMPTLLVTGPANDQAGREVLIAERDTSGATNVWRNTAELLVTPWLA